MQKKIIYLSAEVKIREYYARLLLALNALNRGYQVVIGEKQDLKWCIRNTVPTGIFIGTGVTEKLGTDVLKAKAQGHRCVSFDEEGLAYVNPEVFMATRIKEDIIREIDHFFTWGERHSELVHKKDPTLTNYSAVGNMRFELLKEKYHSMHEETVLDLKKRYGDFILINTNLKMYNHFHTKQGGEDSFYRWFRKAEFIQNSEDEVFYKDRYNHQGETFESYKSLILSLAPKIKPMNIVIRPHTSECVETWKALALKAPNIYVNNRGSVIPWILASRAVIQKNCTTSTETVYLDRPVITYSIKHDPRFDNDITNNIGKVCSNESEVWETLQNLEIFREQLRMDREFLGHYVSNMESKQNVASAVIDILDTIDVPVFDDDICVFKKSLTHKQILKKRIKKTLSAFDRSPEMGLKRQKFPGLSNAEFLNDIKQLSHAISMQPSQIHSSRIVGNTFHITLD